MLHTFTYLHFFCRFCRMYLQACGDLRRRNGYHGDIRHGRTGKKNEKVDKLVVQWREL